MLRWQQVLLIGATLLSSWLAMQAIHELVHVVSAWIIGGQIARVVLHPLTISRTDVALNPHPLIVVWGGPVCGVLVPLAGWILFRSLHRSGTFLLRFFVGFCCVANGLYIGIGSLAEIGDCGEMLRQGASLWQLWLFGAIVTPCGLYLWHGQGNHFGLGKNPRETSRSLVIRSVLVCACLIFLA